MNMMRSNDTKSLPVKNIFVRNKFLLYIISTGVVSALAAGGLVYFLEWRKIKVWKEALGTLQERLAFLEIKESQLGGESLEGSSWFSQVSDNKYVGEATVSGAYFVSGSNFDICFTVDEIGKKLLPKSETVQIFCLNAPDDEGRDKMMKDFFGVDLETVRASSKEYNTKDNNRRAAIRIRDYEIKQFETGAQTGYTTFVKIINKNIVNN